MGFTGVLSSSWLALTRVSRFSEMSFTGVDTSSAGHSLRQKEREPSCFRWASESSLLSRTATIEILDTEEEHGSAIRSSLSITFWEKYPLKDGEKWDATSNDEGFSSAETNWIWSTGDVTGRWLEDFSEFLRLDVSGRGASGISASCSQSLRIKWNLEKENTKPNTYA